MSNNFFNVLRSENIKFKSLKSTWLMTFIVLFFSVIFGLFGGVILNGRDLSAKTADIYDVIISKVLAASGPILYIMIGILLTTIVTNEYKFRTISVSLIATPKRAKVFTAKVTLSVLFTFVLSYISIVISTICTFFVFSPKDKNSLHLSDLLITGVKNQFTTASIGLVLICLIGLNIGFIFRSPVIASFMYLTAVFLFDTIASPLVALLKSKFFDNLLQYTPDGCFAAFAMRNDMTVLSKTTGGIALCVWSIGTLIVGYILFKKKDA